MRSRDASGARGARFVEARVSGLPWAPLRTRPSNSRASASAKALRGAAPPSADVGLDVARMELLAEHPARAIPKLAAAANASRDPAIWNDLAAAYDAADDRTNALSSVDQALVFDPAFREALFNRALLLERFHLREPAIAAWRNYLAHDQAPGWREEALRHLQALDQPLRTFASEIDRQYARLERGDRGAAHDLISIDAGDARTFGELQGLARWGEAWLSHDQAAAERHLAAMRTLATELAAMNGEMLLLDSVEAIAHADARKRDALARAHIAVRDGRDLYDRLRAMEKCEAKMKPAIRDLASAGSPYVLQARLYSATAKYWQSRDAEAIADYRALSAIIPERYAALRAQLEWQWAAITVTRAESGAAVTHLARAIEIFNRLGERAHAAHMHNMTSQAYAMVRDDARVAEHLELALRELGPTTSSAIVHTLNGMVNDALARDDWRAARSFVNLQLAVNESANDAELQIAALLRRARLHAHLQDFAAAQSDLRAAKSIAESVLDDKRRTKVEIDCDAATAVLSNDPRTAIPLLTSVLGYVDTKGSRRLMPELLLRRGRMYLATGDHAHAAADFEAGIVLVEEARGSLEKGERRWGALDPARDLFDEAIAESLRSGGAERAFAYAERKRARSLADVVAQRFDPARIPANAVLIEYAALRDRLLVFTIDRGGYRVDESKVSRDELTALAKRFVDALREGDRDARKGAAAQLHALLIAPVASSIGSHSEVAFITDAFTSGIPFAALPG
ncbi:MAG TPA: hypothetical protein VM733_10210, partial [Thermoanaerobaculia bacterium]|nr:hypothetical protein [Thermoanaerobaculia bacterium]